MRLTHLGHACLLLESTGQRILIDPGSFSRFDDVTDLDAIVITHQHADHVDLDRLPALLEANPQAHLYAEPETVNALTGQGIGAQATAAGEAIGIGGLTLTPVGDRHAVIHDRVPRVGNLGVVLSARGEPTVFHPGDAYDADPGVPVDLLAVPLNAPWCAVKETIAFVRRIAPGAVIPIHDALLTPAGRGMYLRHVGQFGLDGGVTVHDLGDGLAVTV